MLIGNVDSCPGLRNGMPTVYTLLTSTPLASHMSLAGLLLNLIIRLGQPIATHHTGQRTGMYP